MNRSVLKRSLLTVGLCLALVLAAGELPAKEQPNGKHKPPHSEAFKGVQAIHPEKKLTKTNAVVPSKAESSDKAGSKQSEDDSQDSQGSENDRENPAPAPAAEPSPLFLILACLELGIIGYLVFMYLSLKKELKAQQEKFSHLNTQLEYQALYDSLTQLPNRRLFKDRLLETIKLYNRNNTCFGIMVGDLDKFKEVNDTLGHDAGDLLLKEVTARLRKGIRDTDTLARIGGDEFALICPNVKDVFSAGLVCNRLITMLKDPIVVKGKPFQIGISLGVALFPEHASDEDMLIRRADSAMYRAKLDGNSFQMYDDSIDRPRQQ